MKETLSRCEWAIIETLWARSPLFMSEIMDAMQLRVDWNRSSYQTYLKRMVDQGYVGFETVRGSRSYYPLVAREACVENESSAVLSKLTDASARLLLASMIQKSGLDRDDRAALQSLIAGLDDPASKER